MLPEKGYRGFSETELKKSRFLVSLARTDTQREARDFITEVRSTFPDAHHHPTAFVIEEEGSKIARSSDDGEPGGTAGVPMMNSLLHADLVNITVVVTRYFGGTKLGASGLSRAYGGCVSRAVALINPVVRQTQEIWRLDLSHDLGGRIEEELLRAGAAILTKDYEPQGVTVRFTIESNPTVLITRITQGTVTPILDGIQIVEIPAEPIRG